jgi:hypothetical protein
VGILEKKNVRRSGNLSTDLNIQGRFFMKHLSDAPFAAFVIAAFLAYTATFLSIPAPFAQGQDANQPSTVYFE